MPPPPRGPPKDGHPEDGSPCLGTRQSGTRGRPRFPSIRASGLVALIAEWAWVPIRLWRSRATLHHFDAQRATRDYVAYIAPKHSVTSRHCTT